MGCNVANRSKTQYVLNRTEKIEDKYNFLDLISKGSYGMVYRGSLKDNPSFQCAIKSIEKNGYSAGDLCSVQEEIQILYSLKHPNIIRLYGGYEDKNYIHIVQEVCEGGELGTYLSGQGSIPEEESKMLLKTILETIEYMHKKGICHRDLKPSNFLFLEKQRQTLKLIDFGLSANFRLKNMQSIVGSPFYVAPEIIRGRKYDHKCDMWSIGAILYQMLTGELPFEGRNRESVFNKIRSGNLNLAKVVPGARDLVSKLLQPDSYIRIDASQALKHEWVAKI